MDASEAARLLGIADTEVVDVRAHAGWWDALHHDQASHEETWREVPGNPEAPADDPTPGPERDTAVVAPDAVPDGEPAPAPKRRGRA